MSFLSGLSNAIAGINVPEKLEKAFLITSKEGPSSVYLPEASVIVGRSAAAAKRGGFLEFQERGPEEVIVAGIWFWGVTLLQKLFDKLKPKLFKGADHLSGEIAWDKPGAKLPHVDLTAQEMYTKNAGEVGKLLKIKGARWLFSLGVAIWAAGWLVPKLNQWKTNLILEKFYKGKNPHEADQPPAAETSKPVADNLPNTTRQPQLVRPVNPVPPNDFAPYPPQAGWVPPPPVHPVFSHPFAPPPPPLFNQYNQPMPLPPGMPRFSGPASLWNSLPIEQRPGNFAEPNPNPASGQTAGSGNNVMFGGGMTSVLQGLGHLVDQTPYGHMLAVDAAITGGRGYVAAQRSVFETAEVVFRDAVSLYFYILFAPHLMRGMAAAIDPLFKTSVELQPTVAKGVHQALETRLAEMARLDGDLAAALQRGEVPKQVLREIITGASNEALLEPTAYLKQHMRSADITKGFRPLLEKEAAAYFGDPVRGRQLAAQVMEHLAPSLQRRTPTGELASRAHISTADISELLKAIQEGLGKFQNLTDKERANLSVSVKQAFRHTAGMTLELSDAALRQHPEFAKVLTQLSEAERQGLLSRIQRMARIDALDVSNTMLRRNLNALRDFAPQAAVERTESLINWIDKAAVSRMTLDELIGEELSAMREQLKGLNVSDDVKKLLGSANETPNAAQLQKLEAELAQLNQRNAAKLAAQLKELIALVTPADAKAAAAQDLAALGKRNVLAAMDELIQGSQGKAPAEVQALVQRYRASIGELLGGKSGRLFSLMIADSELALDQKIKEILVGGLQHDSAFLNRSLGVVGQFHPDSKLYKQTGKADNMRRALQKYNETLLSRVEEAAAGNAEAKVSNWKGALDNFYKLNRNTHYITRSVALAGTMLCLGWLVPKLQYALTKRLTGKDVNPGIASAESAHGLGGSKDEKAKAPAPPQPTGATQTAVAIGAAAMASGLSRNNFQSFRRA